MICVSHGCFSFFPPPLSPVFSLFLPSFSPSLSLLPLPFPPEDDSWDLITCFCMKPFAGRPMIECNECGTWVHLSCAKIRRTHVPDIFVCQPCRDAKQNIRRSNRARTVPRKRFSD